MQSKLESSYNLTSRCLKVYSLLLSCRNFLLTLCLSQIKRDGLRCSSVNIFATWTACCDLDLWPAESNQVISRRYIPYKFHQDCSSHSWDILATRSVCMKERSRQRQSIMPLPTVSVTKAHEYRTTGCELTNNKYQSQNLKNCPNLIL